MRTQAFPHFLELVLMVALLALGTSCEIGWAEEEEVRTFTNQSGMELEARLLEFVEGGKVRIQRAADSKIFEIEVSLLSPEDQEYLSLELERRKEEKAIRLGLGRNSLIVHGSYLGDRIGAFTAFSNREETEIGANTFLLTPAIGSWLCYRPYELGHEFLIQYNGASTWNFDVQGREVWLTRDSNPPELVGIAIASEGDDARELLRGLDKSKIAETLSIGILGDENLEELEVLTSSIPLAISASTTVDERTFERLANENIVALNVRLKVAGLESLSKYTNLRYLGLRISDVVDGEAIQLPEMPSLEHLLVVDLVGQIRWDELLAGLPNLESLVTASWGKRYSPTGTPITTFEANPRMKTLGLYHNSHQYLDRRALRSLSDLENLRLSSKVFIEEEKEVQGTPLGDVGIDSTKEVTNRRGALDYIDHLTLRRLYLTDPEVSQEAFDDWAATGALRELRSLTGYVVPKAEHLPKLEEYSYLGMLGNVSEEIDFSVLNGLENLLSLSLFRASEEEIEKLMLTRPEKLRNLRLSLGYLENPDLIYRYDGLKYLKIVRNDGNLEQLDLIRLPELEYLNLVSCTNLESLRNVASHGNLQHLWLSSSNYFSSFGEASQNSSLQKLMLSNLPRLESLEAFNETTSVWRIDIKNCDRIPSYDEVKNGNEGIYYLNIEGNNLLEDVQIFPVRT